MLPSRTSDGDHLGLANSLYLLSTSRLGSGDDHFPTYSLSLASSFQVSGSFFFYSYSHSTDLAHGGVHFAPFFCPQSPWWWHVASSPFALRPGASQEGPDSTTNCAWFVNSHIDIETWNEVTMDEDQMDEDSVDGDEAREKTAGQSVMEDSDTGSDNSETSQW